MATKLPWAILICKYKDDDNDPAVTKISDLYTQWGTNAANWVPASAATDNRTILELYELFFTSAGNLTFNAQKYWDEMSHGSIDISDTQVFPCTLDRTAADAAALAAKPGGAAYQNDTFKLAKDALSSQHGVDASSFYAVAVSFQSADFGAQGGIFDGGPGVFMDIRYVISSGIAAWGQEMGHAFGLDHSRTDGDVDANGVGIDYTDPWDIMSTRQAFSDTDPNYGQRGPGLNAWNMRGREWLDESRIWKGPSNQDFSQTVELTPLHWRYRSGYLGAELPGIGGDSPYLVEFRIVSGWDSAFPNAVVLVHRFDGPIDQFLGTHSYIMLGTAGQKAFNVGDIFLSGSGPFSRVRVKSMDVANMVAAVELCYSASAIPKPAVQIRISKGVDPCNVALAEGGVCTVNYLLTNIPCSMGYKVIWSVSGAMPVANQANSGATYSFVMPSPTTAVTVSITIVFDDGTTVSNSLAVKAVSQQQAAYQSFICRILQERMKPHPWWEWSPERMGLIDPVYSKAQIEQATRGTEELLKTLQRLQGRYRG